MQCSNYTLRKAALDQHSTQPPRIIILLPLIQNIVKLLHNEVQGSLYCLSFHSQGGPFNLLYEPSAKEGVSHLLKCLAQSSPTAFCWPKRKSEKGGQGKKQRWEKEAKGEEQNDHWVVLTGKYFRYMTAYDMSYMMYLTLWNKSYEGIF